MLLDRGQNCNLHLFVTAPDYNKSGVFKDSTLRNLSLLEVAKQRFLAKHTDNENCQKITVSMCSANEQALTSRIKSNIIYKSNNRTDFVERILRDTKSVLFVFILLFNWQCFLAGYA